jgi:hypothetical protein
MSPRALTSGEIALVQSVFGTTLKTGSVQIHRRKWWLLQPVSITMAPNGHLWFHPGSDIYCDDFSTARLGLQGFFLHEMTHVWQTQTGLNLVFARFLWSPYRYLPLVPGKSFESYGIEQQAEIVRHYFLLREGLKVEGAGPLKDYQRLLPFLPRRENPF